MTRYDWYPDDSQSSAPTPGRRGYDDVGNSRYFDQIEEDDYGASRGHIGDIKVADPLRRVGSLFIDILIFALAYSVAGAFGADNDTRVIVELIVIALNQLNAFGFGKTGQTLGKVVFGLQAARAVRTPQGKQALVDRGLGINIVRAVLHGLDVVLWFVAIPLVIFTPKHQTIGDLLTKTVIIRPSTLIHLPRAPRNAITIN